VLVMVPAGVFSGLGSPGSPSLSTLAILLTILLFLAVSLGVPFAYFVIYQIRNFGQTPGKRILGVRVVKTGGLPLTPRDVIIRELLRAVDMLPQAGFIAWVSFFASRYQQRLGDLAAGTVVIREFKGQPPMAFPGDAAPGGGAARILQTGALTPELAESISSYLRRIRELDVPTRFVTSGELIEALGYSVGQLNLDQREQYLYAILQQAQAMWMQRERNG
jgi:uncharacterized RDD family membrane protein YckC